MLIYLILAPLLHISTICEEAWPLFNEALGLVIISQLTNHLSWLLVPRLNESLEVVIISQLTNHLSWLLSEVHHFTLVLLPLLCISNKTPNHKVPDPQRGSSWPGHDLLTPFRVPCKSRTPEPRPYIVTLHTLNPKSPHPKS